MKPASHRAKIIACGIQKGGAGKTTLVAMLCYILAVTQGKKVLAVDLDSQGNLTNFLTQKRIYDFVGHTAYDLLHGDEGDNVQDFIYHVNENLHVIPSEDHLSDLELLYYYEFPKIGVNLVENNECYNALKTLLEPVFDDYDYIFLDLPPSINLSTRMALTAADYVIVPLACEKFCYDGLSRYIEAITGIMQYGFNQDLTMLGIAPSLLKSKAAVHLGTLEITRDIYGEFVFDTVLLQKMKVTEFTMTGISTKYAADRSAMKQYEDLLKEILFRIKHAEKYKKAFEVGVKEWISLGKRN